MRSSIQRFTWAWPMRRVTPLSNSFSIGMGSLMPPYTPEMDTVPPRRTASKAA